MENRSEYPPHLLPSNVTDGEGPSLRYHVQGELVPVLTVELQEASSIYFEHHIVLWKHPSVNIGLHSVAGGFKRVMAGMPIFLTEAHGPGLISFSRDGAGHIFAIPLQDGQELDVREHQFLAATANVEYKFTRVKGVANMLWGGTGFFIDRFTARRGPGLVWLHGYGNVFEKTLAPGESIDVEPGGWIYKDPGVSMQIQVFGLRTGLFGGSGNLVFNRFTGPGRVGIQSMYVHLPTAE